MGKAPDGRIIGFPHCLLDLAAEPRIVFPFLPLPSHFFPDESPQELSGAQILRLGDGGKLGFQIIIDAEGEAGVRHESSLVIKMLYIVTQTPIKTSGNTYNIFDFS